MTKINAIKEFIERNKKEVGILGLVILLIGVYAIINLPKKTYAADTDGIFKKQIVNNLSFENGKIEYKDNASILTVDIYNDTDDDYSLNTIDVTVTLENGDKEVLPGYVGNVIKAHEGKVLSTSIDKDITNIKSIEYTINK